MTARQQLQRCVCPDPRSVEVEESVSERGGLWGDDFVLVGRSWFCDRCGGELPAHTTPTPEAPRA